MNTVLQGWLEGIRDPELRRRFFKFFGAITAVLSVVVVTFGIYVSREPDLFDVAEVYRAEYGEKAPVTGVLTTLTQIQKLRTLLDKPGGYLSNDVSPPGVYLDNIPSWEYGVLIESRDMAKAMREQFSRSQSQSTEDESLKQAEPYLNYNNRSWLLPSSEAQYNSGLKQTEDYLKRLVAPEHQEAQFYSRADNLNYWLTTVGTRLGSYSQRLAASIGPDRVNTNLAGDSAANNSTYLPAVMKVRTPWLEIDNVFYEARGYSWALLMSLRAIEYDFSDVLEKKRAKESLQQIIRELEGTQRTLWSPVVMNGGGYGMLANHSLVMSNYVSRANAALIDLRDLLNNG